MAGKIFGKLLDVIGLEESTLDEEEYFDDGYEDEDDYEVFNPEPSRGKKFRDYDDDIDDDYDDDDQVITHSAFGRGSSRKKDKADRESKVVGLAPNNKMKLIIYQPMAYDDTQSIIDNLKNRKAVVVNLEAVESDVAQRILDFMSGAAYAVNGNIHKISRGIFVLVPNNVDISGNIPDELVGNGFQSMASKRKYDNI